MYMYVFVHTDRPENCEGAVSCVVIPNPANNQAEINITLMSESSDHPLCVSSYEFAFQNQLKTVPASSGVRPSATFTILKEALLTSINHEIHTLNDEDTKGEAACPIRISGE